MNYGIILISGPSNNIFSSIRLFSLTFLEQFVDFSDLLIAKLEWKSSLNLSVQLVLTIKHAACIDEVGN
jgi:hypothetical protein